MPKAKSSSPDPDSLAKLRHSCAHVMAQAVQEIFPGTKITIGPAIENGFYYDFDSEHHFTVEDLAKIEKRMRQIAEGNHEFKGAEVTKEESQKYWKARKEPYKLEILEGLEPPITHYTHDTFTDLCRGGHCENTREIRHFKLLSVAGAYWRGDEKNPMLQRIYGTAFHSKEELEEYLHQLEEAKKRDHRKLGTELDLFSIQEEAGPGLIFWHPKGGLVRRMIEDWLRDQLAKRGYDFVFTPHVMRLDLWETSGHTNFYAQNMFSPIEIEKVKYQLKPMNCPGHILIYKNRLRSYRDLPLRFAELGTVYRYERSGVVHGLLRVRGFTQDDAHIFCRPDQIEDEVAGCVDFAKETLKTFGFEKFEIELSTWDPAHPENYTGKPEQWEKAESALVNTLNKMGIPYRRMQGEAAFYGPKIDIKLVDAIRRSWQLSTVQFDFNLPTRFELEYVGEDGRRHQPLMVHRALLGSVERFFGILIEHYAGAFPLWLAPVQVRIMSLTSEQEGYAQDIRKKLSAAGFRADLDVRSEKVGFKVREATLEKIPYMVVVGAKEAAAGTVSLRSRSGQSTNDLSLQEVVQRLKSEVPASPLLSPPLPSSPAGRRRAGGGQAAGGQDPRSEVGDSKL
ncbi:MAG: threonine--tRNA ligase [Elusimicrobia bacterium]|nr:threonine--tRNA ligase [Elusimicrobiota bacterium]